MLRECLLVRRPERGKGPEPETPVRAQKGLPMPVEIVYPGVPAEGAFVQLRRDGKLLHAAKVDCVSEDGSFLWVEPDAVGTRRIFLRVGSTNTWARD
jgi:hypothetical protein